MTKLIRSIILAVSFTVFALPVCAEQDITGIYKCTGYDPGDKSSYDSELTIAKTGDTYSFKWKENDTNFSGTGFFSSTAPDLIAVEWWKPKGQNTSGVIIYKASAGLLDGHWAYADKEVIGTETCKKQ
jgi:hypothetical protein